MRVIKMRVAIYIRVSTKMQQEKGYSLEAQKVELNRYAREQGWNVVREFQDVDSGAKRDKDGLNALLDTIEDGLIEVVLVIDQDRLSRLDTINWEYLKSTLRENSVKIAEPRSGITDLDNEDDEFISDIKNLIARRERKSMTRRMIRGKKQRLREQSAYGKPPLGYKYKKDSDKKAYEIDDKWAWVIPKIDSWYMNDKLGMSIIAEKLNEISVTNTGNRWHENTIQRIINSTNYHGTRLYKFKDGEEIEVKGVFPPLRTEEEYKAIQAEKTKRHYRYKVDIRRPKSAHIIRRVHLTCGVCGRKLTLYNKTSSAPAYYIKHSTKKWAHGIDCKMSVNTRRFEHHLKRILKEVLQSEEQAKKYIDFDDKTSQIPIIEKDITRATSSLNEIKQRKSKMIDLYLDDYFTKEVLDEKQAEIDREIKQMEEMIAAKQKQLNLIQHSSWDYEMLMNYLEITEELEVNLDEFQKAHIFGELFPEGVLYENRLVLKSQSLPFEITVPVESREFIYKYRYEKPPYS